MDAEQALPGMAIVFDEAVCTCPEPHPAEAHDDGFGCTVTDCPCLAGWSFG
jgi:hypothetical protein